jgi:flagellar biosynthesis chaperone FliJ
MEASENQLDLTPSAQAQGIVRVLDDRLVIEAMTVTDERAARVVRERAEAERSPVDTVARAIEIGARVLDSEETAANVDYVRAEFERHAGTLRERLLKQFESGDQALSERLAESFDGTRDGSVQKQIEELMEEALSEQRDEILKLFRVEDGENPLFDYKQTMVEVFKGLREDHSKQAEENRKVIADLRRELIELKERTTADERVAEAEAAGTRKGRAFEDRVHDAIERIAGLRGDCATHTGGESAEGGGRKGDTLIEIGAANGPAAGRIVFEAKDKRLTKNEAWAELNDGMAARAASYAVLVVAGEDRVPAGREQLHEYEGNKLIVAVDREEPDCLALELAYRLAAARIAMSRDGDLAVDAAAVRDTAAEAVTTLKQAQAVRSTLTGIKTSSDKARAGLDGMVEAVRAKLERIESLIAVADPDE